MKRILIVTAALAVLAGCGYALYLKLQSDQKQQVKAALESEQSEPDLSQIEAKFIANMLAQISDSRPVLKLAESRAEHQELKDLAQRYLDTIQDEEPKLKAWQAEWSYTSTKPDSNRLPNYVTSDEFKDMKNKLATISGDEFDKLFIEYLRIQTLSDNTQAYTIQSGALHAELKEFADALTLSRHEISNEQSEWPEQWGYVPPHDG